MPSYSKCYVIWLVSDAFPLCFVEDVINFSSEISVGRSRKLHKLLKRRENAHESFTCQGLKLAGPSRTTSLNKNKHVQLDTSIRTRQLPGSMRFPAVIPSQLHWEYRSLSQWVTHRHSPFTHTLRASSHYNVHIWVCGRNPGYPKVHPEPSYVLTGSSYRVVFICFLIKTL